MKKVPHPGEYIQEEIEARGWSQGDLAYVLGWTVVYVNHLLKGRIRINKYNVKNLGIAFNVDPQLFMNLQAHYDCAHADSADFNIIKRLKILKRRKK